MGKGEVEEVYSVNRRHFDVISFEVRRGANEHGGTEVTENSQSRKPSRGMARKVAKKQRKKPLINANVEKLCTIQRFFKNAKASHEAHKGHKE